MSRYYHINDRKYPSVTTIISDCVPKPALTRWAARCVVEWIINECEWATHDRDGNEFEHFVVTEDQLEKAKVAHKKISDKALDVGSKTHSLIEDFLNARKTSV